MGDTEAMSLVELWAGTPLDCPLLYFIKARLSRAALELP
jgi:hypothetical protein